MIEQLVAGRTITHFNHPSRLRSTFKKQIRMA